MNWKYGFASVTGTSHVKSSLPCQDASFAGVLYDNNGAEILLAVVTDGAGSAVAAQTGARFACDLFCAEVKTHWQNNGTWENLATEFFANWIAKFQTITQENLATEKLKIQDFACTLLAAIVGQDQAVFLQIGDGAMVTATREKPDEYACVCWPQQGEYANTTNFLTDANAAQKIFQQHVTAQIDEVALFTDGLQNLVLDYRTQTAHAPYFAPLFAWLRPRPPGYSQELSAALSVYLSTEKMNARTDDDKTLVLAARL